MARERSERDLSHRVPLLGVGTTPSGGPINVNRTTARSYWDTWLAHDVPSDDTDGTTSLPRVVRFFESLETPDGYRKPIDMCNMHIAGGFPAPLAFVVRAVEVHCDYPLRAAVLRYISMDSGSAILETPLWDVKAEIGGVWRHVLAMPIAIQAGFRFAVEIHFSWNRDPRVPDGYGLKKLPDGTAVRVVLEGTEATLIA